MSKLFNWAAARIVAVFALALPLAAMAAPNATAVWRSNLGQSYTIGGHTYAVSPNGGTLSDGVITMGSAEQVLGATIDLPSGTRNVSVLVKFSGLSLREEPYGGTALAAIVNANNQEVGAGEHKSADHLHAYYIDSSSGYVDYDTIPGTLSSGYMLFSYAPNSGTRFYLGETIGSLAGGTCGSAHYSNVDTSKVAIGGPATTKLYDTSSGFVIEEVAIFVGSYLTASDVAEYAFPTLNLDETAVMTMTELNTAVAAFGENTFNYYSASPVVTLDVEPSDATKTYIQSTLWNGTVFIKDVDKTDIYLTNYGNKNSTLKFSGVNGYIASAQFTNNATPVIELEDSITEGREYGLHLSNGYSFKDGYNNYKFTNTPELKGSGTLKTSGGGDGVLVVVDKWDNFTGKLDLSGKTIWFGTGVPELNNDSWVNLVNKPGTVRLGSTIPSNYSTWTVPNGYHGTVVQTTAANATETAFLTASAWKGTCKIAWNPGNSALDIVNYGNANSVIEIATNFGVYPTQNGGKDGAEVAGEVKIAENVTWTVSNGWTAESYRTTFAKLSGAGNLTVNGGSGGVGDPIPYTITRLEGFTGTIAGTRGKFTIGTIVAATEPTPGTKLVNCTTANAPVLDNTEVYYNNAKVDDIELEFKAGDGIYVKAVAYVVFQQESGQSFIDVTNYYSTVSNAIDAAKAMKKTVVLIAQPEATDTYNISAGETINVKKGEFTFDGIIFPEGAQYNNTTTETAGVTQYKCAVNTATIQYPGEEPVGMTGQLIQILGGLYSGYVPGYAGTVVTVLDGSDATLGDVMPEVFTYNSEAHTYTLKTMVASYNNGYTTTYYPTVSNAVATVASGSTITLVENVALDESVEVAAGKNVTIDLNGKTITGPAGGYVFANAGEVTITGNGTVTGAGGIAENTADGASIAISSGSYTTSSDLFGNVEGGTIEVSGGTFNQSVADEYIAEGFEVKDNGDGTYGIRDYLGWIYEAYDYPNYTGSWSNDVEYADGKIKIEDGNTYTASKPSDGQLVTVAMTLSFDDANDEDEDVGDAKAAVKLASGETSGTYKFQLYTTNELGAAAWANATAGVTATTNVDYTFVFVLDLTNKIYTASIVDGTATNALTVGGASDIPFAYQGAVTPVQQIEFVGAGTVTSIEGSYEDAEAPVEEFNPADPIGEVVLSADQATWLNGQSNYAALAAKIATMSQAAFNKAYLLNLNVTDPAYDGTFTFEVSDFTVGDATVSVKVTLTRSGEFDGPINGTLKLTGTDELGNAFTVKDSAEITDAHFSTGDGEVTIIFTKDANTKFFQPVIE